MPKLVHILDPSRPKSINSFEIQMSTRDRITNKQVGPYLPEGKDGGELGFLNKALRKRTAVVI